MSPLSLHQAKTIYCLAVILIAVILAIVGGLVGWGVSIAMLAGALPLFNLVTRAAGDDAADETLKVVERHLNL